MKKTIVFSSSDYESDNIPVVPNSARPTGDMSESSESYGGRFTPMELQPEPIDQDDGSSSDSMVDQEEVKTPVETKAEHHSDTFKPKPPLPARPPSPPEQRQEAMMVEEDGVSPAVEVVNPPVEPVREVEERRYILYRETKGKFKAKAYDYRLVHEEKALMFARAGQRYPSGSIPVSIRGKPVKGEAPDYVLKCLGHHAFALYKEGSEVPLCSYETQEERRMFIMPFFFLVTVGSSEECTVKSLVSQRPKMNPRGQWFLDFHNKFTIPSVKNTVFVANTPSREGDELVMVRKVGENSLSIDVSCDIPLTTIFTIGLATMVNKIK